MIKMIKPENMVFGTGEIEHGNGFSLVGLKRYHENWIKNEERGLISGVADDTIVCEFMVDLMWHIFHPFICFFCSLTDFGYNNSRNSRSKRNANAF